MTELFQLSAAEIARSVSAGEVSATEVADAHIARIEALEPEVVLERDRHPGERPQARATRAPAVDLVGPAAGVVVEAAQIGPYPRLDLGGAREAALDHLGRQQIAGPDRRRDLLGPPGPDLIHRPSP